MARRGQGCWHDGRGDETPGLDELREVCWGKMGGYKITKRMIVVEAIPRNHTGKILRAPLVERAAAFKASS